MDSFTIAPSSQNTMNGFSHLLAGVIRSDTAWTCSSCARALRRSPATPFFKHSIRRDISNSSKPRQNAAPTMEQLRAPFQKKNSSTLYYTLSIILGTVAFSYGSVPMYKMVRCCDSPHSESMANSKLQDLPNNRLGRPTHQSSRPRWS